MPKESKRQLQVGEMIRRNFSTVLMQDGIYIFGAEPLVSVTDVLMSSDMSQAKIYLSVYNVENKQEVIDKMDKNMHRLKSGLAHRIRKHIRRMPNIAFFIDETLDEISRVDELLDKLKNEQ